MKKKLVSLLLCSALAASLLAGCGNASSQEAAGGTEVEKDDTKEETTETAEAEEAAEAEAAIPEGKSSMWLIGDEESAELSLAIKVGPKDKDPEDMWFFKYYEEMTGVHMNVTGVLSQDWGDKKQIMMASGEYPGIIWSGSWTPEEMTQYSSDGTFLDLTDYIQYMPNYKAVMDMVEDSWKQVTSPDGGMYSTAYVDPSKHWASDDTVVFLNKEWLANVGLEEPETLDEFYNVLKAFKEQDADGDGDVDNEIPYSAYYGMESNIIRTFMLNSFGFDTAAETDFNIGIQSWNDEAVYMPLTERYKEYLVFMKKLMDEGLLDQDLFSQDETQYHAKTSEGLCGVIGDIPILADYDGYEKYTAVALKYDENSEQTSYAGNPVRYGSVVITDNCEDPVLAAKWIDQFYAPINAYNQQAGPIILEYPDGTLEFKTEGVTEDEGIACHVLVDEEGNYLGVTFPGATEELDAWDWLCQEKPANGMFCSNIAEYWYYGMLFDGFPCTSEEVYEYEKARYDNPENDTYDRMNGHYRSSIYEETHDYMSYGYPQVYLSEDQLEWVEAHKTILEDYVLQMEAKFITGAADIETEYDAFIEELKNKGAEEYQTLYAELYSN